MALCFDIRPVILLQRVEQIERARLHKDVTKYFDVFRMLPIPPDTYVFGAISESISASILRAHNMNQWFL